MTGTNGETLIRFCTEFHNRLSRQANWPEAPLKAPGKIVAVAPQIRGTGAQVCENESRNAQVTGNPQEGIQVGRHRN